MISRVIEKANLPFTHFLPPPASSLSTDAILAFVLAKKEQKVTSKYIRSCLFHWSKLIEARGGVSIYENPAITLALA